MNQTPPKMQQKFEGEEAVLKQNQQHQHEVESQVMGLVRMEMSVKWMGQLVEELIHIVSWVQEQEQEMESEKEYVYSVLEEMPLLTSERQITDLQLHLHSLKVQTEQVKQQQPLFLGQAQQPIQYLYCCKLRRHVSHQMNCWILLHHFHPRWKNFWIVHHYLIHLLHHHNYIDVLATEAFTEICEYLLLQGLH